MRPSRIAQRSAAQAGCSAAERARSNGTLARASACAVHRRDVALAEESFDLFLGAGPAGRTVRSRPTARSVYMPSKSKMPSTPACHERASKHPNDPCAPRLPTIGTQLMLALPRLALGRWNYMRVNFPPYTPMCDSTQARSPQYCMMPRPSRLHPVCMRACACDLI